MKSSKYISILFVFLILNSCSLFTKKSEFKNINCSDQDYSKLKDLTDYTYKKIQSCLASNGRTEDSNKLNDLLGTGRVLHLSCDLRNKNISVLAESRKSKSYPGFKVNSSRLNKDFRNDGSFARELFHETIHLLGYEHAQGFDLSEIAEMCCWYSDDKKLNTASLNSCKLFKFSNNQWVSPEYLKTFSQSLAEFGNLNLALKTSLSASVHHAKQKNYDMSQAAALSVLKVLANPYTGRKITRPRIRELKNSPGIVSSLILSKLGFASKNEEGLLFSRKVYNEIKSNFYNAAIEQEKLKLFDNVSQSINTLISLDAKSFVKNWADLRDRSLYVCRDLKENEKSDIEAIMSGYSSLVFTFKNDIPAGDFYEIATYWSKPCDLQKSYQSELIIDEQSGTI